MTVVYVIVIYLDTAEGLCVIYCIAIYYFISDGSKD